MIVIDARVQTGLTKTLWILIYPSAILSISPLTTELTCGWTYRLLDLCFESSQLLTVSIARSGPRASGSEIASVPWGSNGMVELFCSCDWIARSAQCFAFNANPINRHTDIMDEALLAPQAIDLPLTWRYSRFVSGRLSTRINCRLPAAATSEERRS